MSSKKDEPKDEPTSTEAIATPMARTENAFLLRAREADTRLSFQGPCIQQVGRVLRWDRFTIMIQPEGTEYREMLLLKHALAYIEPVAHVE